LNGQAVMNKRIRELAEQAGYPDYMTYGQDKVLERFAELIIREAADIATINSNQWHSAGKFVLSHFGFEE